MQMSRLIPWAALIAATLTWACETRPPSSAASAAKFISTLSEQSPRHDGVPLRTYEIRDLDHDGKLEVLEHISAYEDVPGFLNVEIENAFEWINVYREKDSRFVEATKEFSWFLTERKAHYQFWLRVLEHLDVLNEDSRKLVEENKEHFREVLSGYLQKLNQLSR